jgi:hypothetical protein
MTTTRFFASVSASSERCARRNSWNSGPPSTSEKFSPPRVA